MIANNYNTQFNTQSKPAQQMNQTISSSTNDVDMQCKAIVAPANVTISNAAPMRGANTVSGKDQIIVA